MVPRDEARDDRLLDQRRQHQQRRAFDLNPRPRQPLAVEGVVLPAHVESASLEAIWRESDAISLHCPLTTVDAYVKMGVAAAKNALAVLNA